MNKKIINKYKSPNFDNRENNTKIKYIIIHYTETETLSEAVKILCSKAKKVSCHYIVDTNGLVYNLVTDSKRAWHAGVSFWKKTKNLNNCSIGIEIINKGEKKKATYTKVQINSLINLLKFLQKKYNIKKENFLGHSDIAPSRKIDPGIFFPWKILSEKSFGNWIEIKKKSKKHFLELNKDDFFVFLKNLKQIGFSETKTKKSFNENKAIIEAFHRHHLPNLLHCKPTYLSLLKTEELLKLD